MGFHCWLLTFLAEAEKARRWILEAMNIVKDLEEETVMNVAGGLRCSGCSAEDQMRLKNSSSKEYGESMFGMCRCG